MIMPISKLILTGMVSLITIAFSTGGSGIEQRRSDRPLRVLVDASRDGGTWWAPQGPYAFDPQKHHQGKAMADAMRKKGWEVTELIQGELITLDKLRDFDVVIRPPAFLPYTEDEAVAYRESVARGIRLLVCPGRDRVTKIFGLRFENDKHLGSVQKWLRHPLTANISCCDFPWAVIAETPEEAVALAWLDRQEPNEQPVLAYFPYGKGEVISVGLSLIFSDPDHPIFNDFFEFLGDSSSETVQRQPVGPPVFAKEPAGPPAPRLIEPADDATLPQPEAGDWRFDWEDVPTAKKYKIFVSGRTAVFPLLEKEISVSEYTILGRKGSYIPGHNLDGWYWRVRAQDQNDEWGIWSELRRFSVAPRARKVIGPLK
jgi:hypothetical protein